MTITQQSRAKVDIWNRALLRIGATLLIEDPDATGMLAAEVCRLNYDDIVGQTFEAFPWPFAITQAVLSASSDTREGWEYVYVLPADCVTPVALLSEGQRIGRTTPDLRMSFDIQSNSTKDGKLLLTDYESTEDFEVLEYVAWIETVTAYPRAFIDAIAWRLAGELALAVQKDAKKAAAMFSAHDAAVARAQADELNQTQPDAELDPLSVLARG